MLLIGLTGGVASGKSVVASFLEEKGGHIVDFDILSRLVVMPEKPAWREIVKHFGADILNPDRTLDRNALGGIVFHDRKSRSKLEGITHPRIGEEYLSRLKEIREREPEAVVVVVVPLLIEVGMHQSMDSVIVVYVSPDIQVRRLMERDQCARKDALKRIEAQMPLKDKVKYADFVINNEGPLEDTKDLVSEVWGKILLLKRDLNKKS